MSLRRAVFVVGLAGLVAVPAPAVDDAEARVSLDVGEAPLESIVGLLVELGGGRSSSTRASTAP